MIDSQKSLNADAQKFDAFFQSIENFSGNVLVAIDGKSTYIEFITNKKDFG